MIDKGYLKKILHFDRSESLKKVLLFLTMPLSITFFISKVHLKKYYHFFMNKSHSEKILYFRRQELPKTILLFLVILKYICF